MFYHTRGVKVCIKVALHIHEFSENSQIPNIRLHPQKAAPHICEFPENWDHKPKSRTLLALYCTKCWWEQMITDNQGLTEKWHEYNHVIIKGKELISHTNTSLLSCFCCWWRHCLLSIVVYFPLSFLSFSCYWHPRTLHLPYLTLPYLLPYVLPCLALPYLILPYLLPYILPYLPYLLPYILPYLTLRFTLALTLPYLLPYLTFYLTLPYILPYLTLSYILPYILPCLKLPYLLPHLTLPQMCII